jgi:hypothetical protein
MWQEVANFGSLLESPTLCVYLVEDQDVFPDFPLP